jgi:hypothetical protein
VAQVLIDLDEGILSGVRGISLVPHEAVGKAIGDLLVSPQQLFEGQDVTQSSLIDESLFLGGHFCLLLTLLFPRQLRILIFVNMDISINEILDEIN